MGSTMPLSWNEIKSRSIAFSKQWENESSEDAEAKSFWDGFFNVFGISRKRVASFEAPVKKLGNRLGFIDLFWKGMLLVEHKSRGKSLDRAYAQALDYFPGINERDLPQYVLVSDFERFHLYDFAFFQSRMRCDSDDRDPVLLRSEIPEDPIGRRCGLLGVGLKDLFSLRSFKDSELVCPKAWMSRVF